ncbi:MAG: DNA-protecting protein DprA [Alphaproteobacteria bacterium]|nr:DNA-protecting protein DprA [Alphaproteobacteria bacterium]
MTPVSQTLSEAERLDWLRLIRSENVGPVTFRRLLEHFGSAEAALAALPGIARRGGLRKTIGVCPKAAAEREMEALRRMGAHLLARCEPGYPAALAAIADAPPLLAVRGHLSLLRRPAVAVVGARNASATGRKIAWRLAADLSQAGLLVVSGLARGIDTAAHEGALAEGTAAANAGGVDTVYPPENAALYDRIVAQGVVVSEIPLGEQPQARHFPRRNRIVSGLSLGVVVVEAAARSGSLITARMALEQGREVFAVPGSPADPRAAGPNGLLRQGAFLVERADDVLSELQPRMKQPMEEPPGLGFVPRPAGQELPPEDGAEMEACRSLVAASLGVTPVTVDEIVRQCQLSPSVVSLILLEMELAGRIERHPGHQVALVT